MLSYISTVSTPYLHFPSIPTFLLLCHQCQGSFLLITFITFVLPRASHSSSPPLVDMTALQLYSQTVTSASSNSHSSRMQDTSFIPFHFLILVYKHPALSSLHFSLNISARAFISKIFGDIPNYSSVLSFSEPHLHQYLNLCCICRISV